MAFSKENLTKHFFTCYKDDSKECTNITHAQVYGYIAHRGEDADLDGFVASRGEEVKVVIDEMGFAECTSTCSSGKKDTCYMRDKLQS